MRSDRMFSAASDNSSVLNSLPFSDSQMIGCAFTSCLATTGSSALAGRLVSTLNPRAIVLGEQSGFAFNRGTQQVELVSRDRDHFIFNFYLPRFQQACNTAPEGCSPGDLYTPRIESDWTSVRIVPRYRGAAYLGFLPPAQTVYLALEDMMERGHHRDLATHYLVVADA